ncbi:hypothetical protein D3C72_1608880 [compost metagenome]
MHRPERFSARWRRSTDHRPTGSRTISEPRRLVATSTAAASPPTPGWWSSAWCPLLPRHRPRPGHRRIRNRSPAGSRRPSTPSSPHRCRSGPVRHWKCVGCACAECNRAGSPGGSGRTHRKSPLARQSPWPGSTGRPAGSTPSSAPAGRRGYGPPPDHLAAARPGRSSSAPAPAVLG